MNPILKQILKNKGLRNLAPYKVRRALKRAFDMTEYNNAIYRANNPYANTPYEWTFQGDIDVTVGIIYDVAHYHRYYQSACIDLGISYQVIDIRKNDWIEELKNFEGKVVFAWPSLTTSVLKEMLDERSKLIEDSLGMTLLPSSKEIFLLDNKRRVRDWVMSNGFTPPDTWTFYDEKEALHFVKTCPIPIVFKSIKEGVSRGVVICRSRSQINVLVKKCFREGFVPKNTDSRNRQWNFVLFQEYLADVEEKRMIRIGDSFLAIDKVKIGDFHSGSGEMKWSKPDRKFLDSTKEITDKGGFRSMNVDFFISKDNRVLVNELHTMFHGPQIFNDEGKGRFLYIESEDKWGFQEGNYYRNYCCNLRILEGLKQAGIEVECHMDWINKPAFEYAQLES